MTSSPPAKPTVDDQNTWKDPKAIIICHIISFHMFDHLLLVSPRGDDVIRRARDLVWRFSEVNSSAVLHNCKIHLHRLFEQYFN